MTPFHSAQLPALSGLWAASRSYRDALLRRLTLRPADSTAIDGRCLSPISATNLLSTSTRRFHSVPQPTAYAAEYRRESPANATTPKAPLCPQGSHFSAGPPPKRFASLR